MIIAYIKIYLTRLMFYLITIIYIQNKYLEQAYSSGIKLTPYHTKYTN